jgi:hypothetical protein
LLEAEFCETETSDQTLAIHDFADWVPEFVNKRWVRAGYKCELKDGHRVWTLSGQRPDNGRQRLPTEPNRTEPNVKTGPVNLTESAESDRTERKGFDQFRSRGLFKLCGALGLEGAAAERQRASLTAVLVKIQTRPDRTDILRELVALAKDKRNAGLRKPVAAWQKQVNERYR